ncbi:hypothetical protein SKAU_G00188160 [Synaphobranchus kaupii]|uniref:Uncharacterized protein n=1 Tax=Synaphobranchus kaupii TaxID=118154 RepID=A0A9Q1FD26_SYNKA|nr:hypothetical protein SKAU_G00188160 [Synaphobranchus kaupii]
MSPRGLRHWESSARLAEPTLQLKRVFRPDRPLYPGENLGHYRQTHLRPVSEHSHLSWPCYVRAANPSQRRAARWTGLNEKAIRAFGASTVRIEVDRI